MVVITKHHNDYDQHGGYFVAVYNSKKEAETAGYSFGLKKPYKASAIWYEVHEIVIGIDYAFDGTNQVLLEQKD